MMDQGESCNISNEARQLSTMIYYFKQVVYVIIDRVEEGLETEVIHVMFYNEVYVVALGPSVYLLITPAKTRETYCVQSISLRATPITESHAP